MSDVPKQMIRQENLSIVFRGQADSGKCISTGCLFVELDGIPERELDKLTQDEERLEKSFSAFAFYMDRQQEERKRCVIITCDMQEFVTDGWNFTWLDMPANPEKEPLSIVMCGHVDSGKRTTTGRLLLELGGIPEREFDKLKQDAERLGARNEHQLQHEGVFHRQVASHHHRYSWPQGSHQEYNRRRIEIEHSS